MVAMIIVEPLLKTDIEGQRAVSSQAPTLSLTGKALGQIVVQFPGQAVAFFFLHR